MEVDAPTRRVKQTHAPRGTSAGPSEPERLSKAEERKRKNRESAQRSRAARLAQIDALGAEVAALQVRLEQRGREAAAAEAEAAALRSTAAQQAAVISRLKVQLLAAGRAPDGGQPQGAPQPAALPLLAGPGATHVQWSAPAPAGAPAQPAKRQRQGEGQDGGRAAGPVAAFPLAALDVGAGQGARSPGAAALCSPSDANNSCFGLQGGGRVGSHAMTEAMAAAVAAALQRAALHPPGRGAAAAGAGAAAAVAGQADPLRARAVHAAAVAEGGVARPVQQLSGQHVDG